jgi:hypothetical protein
MPQVKAFVFHEIMYHVCHIEREASFMQMNSLAKSRRNEWPTHMVAFHLSVPAGIELQVIFHGFYFHPASKQMLTRRRTPKRLSLL